MTGRRATVTICSIAVLALLLPAGAAAQKAKPLRIEFESGSPSRAVSGTLGGRQQMEYVVAVGSEREVRMDLVSSPPGLLVVTVRDPNGTELWVRRSSATRWVVVALRPGDHDIWVRRVSNKPGTSTYTLTVTLR